MRSGRRRRHSGLHVRHWRGWSHPRFHVRHWRRWSHPRFHMRCGGRRRRHGMSLPGRVRRWTRSNNGLLQVQRRFLRRSATGAAGELLPAIVVLVPVLRRQLLLLRLLLLLRRRLGLMSRASVLWGHRSGASGRRSKLLESRITSASVLPRRRAGWFLVRRPHLHNSIGRLVLAIGIAVFRWKLMRRAGRRPKLLESLVTSTRVLPCRRTGRFLFR